MPLRDAHWICLTCNSIYDVVYRDGSPVKLRDALEEAYYTPEAVEHELTLFCEKCNKIVGSARIPTGSDAFIYTGNVSFVYSLDTVVEEVSEIAPETTGGESNGERESVGETG